MKRLLPRILGAIFLLKSLGGLRAADAADKAAGAKAGRPNVIIILADDLGYSDLGCYGGEIATPNLDKLAAGGLRFTQFYNSAKCEQTRSSLMSGQYWQVCELGIKRGMTMGEALRATGYATFAVGKWHLEGNPVQRGFDHYFGHLSGASDYFKGSVTHRLDDKPFRPPTDGTFYTTDANADYAVQFLSESRRQHPEKPFFLYLAFNAPHAPLQAWPADIARYRGKYRVGWDRLRAQRYEKQLALGITKKEWALSPRPETIPAWDTLTEKEQDFEDARMAVYAAQVDRMDQAIGRVLARVKELGQEENTLVIFLSDNGANPFDHGGLSERNPAALLPGTSRLGYGLGWANAGETPFRHYKRNMFNGGNCTACIARWPAVIQQPGGITDQRAHLIDLMATVMDVGGGQWPASFAGQDLPPLPGTSLRPILAGEQRTPHDVLYFHLYDHRAAIAGDRKVVSDWGRPWELFDLATDRTELHDLAAAQPEQAAHLEKLWTDWAAQVHPRIQKMGGEPIYRHQTDASEQFVGGGAGETDEEEKSMREPKRERKKRKDAASSLPLATTTTTATTTATAATTTTRTAGDDRIRARIGTSLAVADGQLVLTCTGNDPGLSFDHLPGLTASGPYRLVFSVQSHSSGEGSLYWTTAAGTKLPKGKHQSIPVAHDGEWHDFALTIDTPERLHAFRLDPCAGPGEVRIKGLRLQTAAGADLLSWPAARH